MDQFQRAREDHASIPIPEELPDRVRAGIRQGRSARRRRKLRHALTAAAACLAVAAGLLDLSPSVAAAAEEVPVLGGLFRILTVRSYRTVEDGVPVVFFPRYSIAAGAAGIPEFPIL